MFADTLATTLSDEPDIYIDRVPRVPIPELAYSSSDPAALYARQLTHLQIRAVCLLAEGYDFRSIALKLRVRRYYAKDLVKQAKKKLGMPHNTALILAWRCELFHEGMFVLGLTPYNTKSRL